ncbi:MAG: Txe/YoeB family addiction module toxin [Clostridia bacterium]|nr:Txe/YoeB family addiction module toxin [Clostridia bacterium]
MSYAIVFTKQAKKDLEKVKSSNLKDKALQLLRVLSVDPLQPPLEKLTGTENTYSRRMNLQHRLVYQIFEEEKTVKIIRMWTHYGDN